MRVLVTGAKGFIGKNLLATLESKGYDKIYEYDIDSSLDDLNKYCKDADFIFHLAGVNRPKEEKEFKEGNFGFTSLLLEKLKKYNNKARIMISSSIQAKLNNPYGVSKKMGEDLIFNYAKEVNTKAYVYRFPNVFGKWSRPNYNSVVATFANNIANDIQIIINDENANLKLVYIDDVVNELINALEDNANKVDDYCYVNPVYTTTVGKLAKTFESFKHSRNDLGIPNMNDELTKKLYAMYLTYLKEDDFSYFLKMNEDNRGSFTEFIRTNDRGQVSVNISKPGITKGNHWHHTKNEKFLVVSGTGVIRFRKVNENKVIEYYVSGEKLEVVDIPPGYTHNIENLGKDDMVTVMWVNEPFDKDNPDTYFEGV